MKISKLNKKWIILIIVILLIGVGIAKHEKKKPVQVKKDIPNVTVQKISTQNITSEVDYASKLQGVQSITVGPKTSGKVATVNVNVGDKVTAGQVLFTLDTSDLQANLQVQQASLDAANAKVNDSINAAQQQVGTYQINFNDAKDTYEKDQKLYDVGAISKQELDKAKSVYETASINLQTAQNNLSLLQQKFAGQSTAAVAGVEQAQAGVNSAQVSINNATITSPITGIVSAKNVDVGAIASGTVGTVTIIDTSSLIAQVTVPDKVVGKLQVGQSVPVVVTALGETPVTGVIDSISPDVDSKNNSYTVKVKINNSDGKMMAGMFAKISLPDQIKNNVLVVPNEAVKIENGVDYIYTVEGNKVKKIIVQIGISNDKVTEIAGNVKEGTELITEGQNLLSDGETINVVK